MTRTNAYTLLCVGIRAVAVYVAANFLIGIPAAYASLRRGVESSDLVFTVLAPLFLVLLVAGVLWLFADRIARLSLARPEDATFDSSLEPRVWLGLAVSAIGAWFLFGGLADLAYLSSKWILMSRTLEDAEMLAESRRQLLPDVAATLFQLVLALVFLLQGQGLSRWIHRMRYGSAPASPGDRDTAK